VEALRGSGIRLAEIADAAGAAGVLQVAEIAHQGEHAAAAGFGIADHLLDLGALVPGLGGIGFAPGVRPARDVLGRIDQRAAVDPEFFERLLEGFQVHGYAALEHFLGLRLVTQSLVDTLQHFGVGVVALEEVIVGVAVGVGVHQDGAGGLAVAARAPDLLVVGLQLPGRPCG